MTIALGTETSPASRARRPRRRVRSFTADDAASLWGAVASSCALVTIVYEHLVDGTGTVGFIVAWYVAFLAIYAAIVSISHPRPIVVDRLITTAMYAAAALILFSLGSAVGYILWRGHSAYLHANFWTHTAAGVGPTAPLSQGGVLHAIVGTLVEVGLAVLISVPLGVGTAVYMSEVGGRLARLVRTVVEAMTALPEILAGLFVYVTLIVGLGWPPSGSAAAIAMSVTMIPVIARAAEVALRVVPGGLREASLALGASRWATVRKVVLPNAAGGLVNASIMGVARGSGETAVVLITSGASTFLNANPLKNPMNSLPLYIWTVIKSGETAELPRAFGAASILLLLVLVPASVSRYLSRDKAARR